MASDIALLVFFAHVHSNRDAFLHRLMDYVRHPSISAHGLGIGEVAALLVAQLNALGLHARAIPTAGWPMVVARRDVDAGKPTVMLYGHYDVQPPDPLDQWISPPFEPTIRDGRIYARGIADNKGQHFAQLLALETWLRVRGELPCNVVVLLEGEEEIGSPHIADFARAHGRDIACDFVVIADGPAHESGRPTVGFGVRGVASFELRARGASHDLHSGNWGGIAPNPIWTLVQLLATMKDKDGRITIDGFFDNVIAPTQRDLVAMSALPLDEAAAMREIGVSVFDKPDRPFYERTMFWPTLTINGLHGGYGGPGSKTVLPSEAFAKCDIRMVKAQAGEEIFAKVEAHVKRHAPNVEFIRGSYMNPSRTPLDSPYAAVVEAAVAQGQGGQPLLIPSAGGSLPDYVFTDIIGVPVIGTPYGNFDEMNHAPNENLEIERFFSGIRTGIALLAHTGAMAH